MSWVRIDDHAPEHPKQMQAGPEACWLWVRGLAYCSRYLTDGLIPHAVIESWGGVRAFKLAVRLVNVGLWEYAEDGAYRVHDYHEYQPSKDQVSGRRHAAVERVKRWRYARGNAHGNATVTPVTLTAPDPDPDPGTDTPNGVSGNRAPTPTLKPLGYKPRIDVAWPGRPPVPSGLHAEFITKLGGDAEVARQKLLAWYPVTADAWDGKPIGDDDWKFWRLRFREWVGTTAMPVPAAAPTATDDEIWADIEAQKALRKARR